MTVPAHSRNRLVSFSFKASPGKDQPLSLDFGFTIQHLIISVGSSPRPTCICPFFQHIPSPPDLQSLPCLIYGPHRDPSNSQRADPESPPQTHSRLPRLRQYITNICPHPWHLKSTNPTPPTPAIYCWKRNNGLRVEALAPTTANPRLTVVSTSPRNVTFKQSVQNFLISTGEVTCRVRSSPKKMARSGGKNPSFLLRILPHVTLLPLNTFCYLQLLRAPVSLLEGTLPNS